MKAFRIEVAADSLVQMDEQAEKQGRMEFLTATGAFIEKVVQAGQIAPDIVPLLLEMLKFGVRGFPIGKTMEGVFETATQQAQQPKEAPQIPPEIQQQIEEGKQELQRLGQENAHLKTREGIDKYKADKEAATTVEVKNMELGHAERMAKYNADSTDKLEEKKIRLGKDPAPDATDRAEQALAHFQQITSDIQNAFAQLQQNIYGMVNAKKSAVIKRGPDGRAAAVEMIGPDGQVSSHQVVRGPDGSIMGAQ